METSIDKIKTFLSEPKKFAIVGASTNEEKPGYYVPQFLKDRGFEIIPINPFAEKIHGMKPLNDLNELSEDVDGVIIYRNSEAATQEVKKAVNKGIEWIWLPEGVRSEEGKEYAKNNQFVQNKCPKRLIETWIKEGTWN